MSIDIPSNAKQINKNYLKALKPSYIKNNYPIPKWIIFSEIMLDDGWEVYLYRAKSTVSKYIFIVKNNLSLKIRFSNHRPNFHREMQNDCDYFVGVGHTGVITTEKVIDKIKELVK